MILAFSIAGLIIALIPLGLFLQNLPLFCVSLPSPPEDQANASTEQPAVSVLIPARDEEQGIGDSVRAALECREVQVEVVVLDDHSTDRTAEIVGELADSDPRVRYEQSQPLPPDWNGKQFACYQLASLAKYDLIVFLDADVRLHPSSLYQLLRRKQATGVALLSAFPRQLTGSLLEKWIIPLMHFILLGFLPLKRMRESIHPAYAAGCGQLFLTSRSQYELAGGHRAIAASRHDGLKLPRAFREAGMQTDVIDGTRLATCRMYQSSAEVIRGVLKNAIEGIAAPRLILPFSVLLLGGSVLPVVTLFWAWATGAAPALIVSVAAIVAGHLPRLIAAVRFRQSVTGVVCHSLGTTLFVALQWVALANHLAGRQVAWRGRSDS